MAETPVGEAGYSQADELFALVYEELRRIARSRRRQAGNPPTLDTAALISEAWLKLASSRAVQGYSRTHFLSLAARAMRQVLVDHARNRGRQKRGGNLVPVTLDLDPSAPGDDLFEVIALDAALAQLSALDANMGQLVEWHVFGGFGLEEIAGLQGVNVRTMFRRWRAARAFLVQQLGMADGQGDGQRTLAPDQRAV